ncbi:conserved hypothetical protein [Rhizobium johnstonii 3841]|uniref:Uncharacterized protein n=1 Tax=Rhizobium johnstonii (strain DSM 114642 / LMG 32736 / 3841) TaxID=216596 RepID=Q1MEM7_RHIJ3|nr:conserved hypothetical protein [Rhizobium johnstonii 3841]
MRDRWDCLSGKACRAKPPSGLPAISPTGGEIGWAHWPPQTMSVQHGETVDEQAVQATCHLPTCGGDARQGRGGLQAHPVASNVGPNRCRPNLGQYLTQTNPAAPQIHWLTKMRVYRHIPGSIIDLNPDAANRSEVVNSGRMTT